MAATDLDAIARALHEAWVTRTPIEPVSSSDPGITPDHAYEVQARLATLVAGGEIAPSGYKVGLTSTAMQRLLGVDEPDYAVLLPQLRVPSGGQVERSALIQPKAEAEIAVVLAEEIKGPGVAPQDVADATAGVAAAIEVIDSRIAGWRIGLVDTVADMASTARYIVSDRVVSVEGFEPRLIGVAVEVNGRMAATGAGAAALGDPFAAAAWTINTLARHDVVMSAGMVILTGAVHAAFDVAAGDQVVARFDRLGTVEVGFS